MGRKREASATESGLLNTPGIQSLLMYSVPNNIQYRCVCSCDVDYWLNPPSLQNKTTDVVIQNAQSQVPDAGYINVRDKLSTREVK